MATTFCARSLGQAVLEGVRRRRASRRQPSLATMLVRWRATVLSLRTKTAATSRLVCPVATGASTSASRGVRRLLCRVELHHGRVVVAERAFGARQHQPGAATSYGAASSTHGPHAVRSTGSAVVGSPRASSTRPRAWCAAATRPGPGDSSWPDWRAVGAAHPRKESAHSGCAARSSRSDRTVRQGKIRTRITAR